MKIQVTDGGVLEILKVREGIRLTVGNELVGSVTLTTPETLVLIAALEAVNTEG